MQSISWRTIVGAPSFRWHVQGISRRFIVARVCMRTRVESVYYSIKRRASTHTSSASYIVRMQCLTPWVYVCVHMSFAGALRLANHHRSTVLAEKISTMIQVRREEEELAQLAAQQADHMSYHAGGCVREYE